MTNAHCPCGSQTPYCQCCEPFHTGEKQPLLPESLMRSRFSAYVLKCEPYLLETWAPETRPEQIALPPTIGYRVLEVFEAPPPKGTKGKVHFRALFTQNETWGFLEEHARFIKVLDKWFYLDGTVKTGVLKMGRNAQCPCGSGSKFKACCG